ncbi:hypothetical protein GCM10010218_64780 [Streptomyces mashuensis]|uniref:Uncharacterized protein n=1 Tax=Streptomyces mashuensis TaxID=33904 RepID=A0A919BAR8_9ACTN|nr:hypothetical protein [Streptomyces mashuensis]GHF74757.1 hypothetical protein GCM10010218_64780 [Streptomyces mashuensis]
MVDHDPHGKYLGKDAETLSTFKGRIDSILRMLEDSQASQTSLDHRTIAKSAYGKDFHSAEVLHSVYETVHTRLKELSRVFGDQIEAAGLAALVADRGYDGVDAEQEARMRAIQERTERHFREAQKHSGGHGNDKGAGSKDGKKAGY